MISAIKKKIVFALLCCAFIVTSTIGIFSIVSNNIYADSADVFAMVTGAETRTDDQKVLRFTTKIKKTELDKLSKDGKTVKVVTLITPTRYLTDNNISDADFTKEKLDELSVKYHSVVFSAENENLTNNADGDYYKFQACEYGILEQNISRAFSARSYLEVDGAITQYTDYSAENNSRAIYNVAKTAIESGALTEGTEAYNNVAALCKDYTVTINSDYVDFAAITVKRGERLSYYTEALKGLTVENLAYVTGYNNGEEAYDMNDVITEDITLDVQYAAVKFSQDGEVYAVSCADDALWNYTDTIVIPEKFKNASVTYVGMDAFKDNARLKEIYLPETITELRGECFWACSNLEFISMPGITYLPAKNETDYKHNNFVNCYNLKTVIVGNDFDNSGRNFFAGNNTPEGYKGQVDILVKGMSVKKLETTSYPVDVTLNYNESKWNDANNALLSGRVFYYNENKATCINAWYYEENGKAVKQEKTTDHEYDGGVCACGKYQTEGLVYVFDTDHYYVNKYTGSATEVYVAKEYDDGINGKHPVTTIKKEAFQKKTIIIKVVLPESVENVEGEAFFECTALETLIMPGVKVFNEGNGAFNLTHNCIALRTIVLNGEADIGRKVFNSDKDEGKGVANVYLTSANKLKFRDAQGNYVEDYFKNQNNILSGKFYEYSDTQKSDCWHYVNGVPTLWE